MLDRKFYPDSAAIVPLSANSLIDVRENGSYEYIGDKAAMPVEEEQFFQKYLTYYKK